MATTDGLIRILCLLENYVRSNLAVKGIYFTLDGICECSRLISIFLYFFFFFYCGDCVIPRVRGTFMMITQLHKSAL